MSWASNCDYNNGPKFYDGWVAGFKLDYNNLSSGFSLLGSFKSEPIDGAKHDGGIWMAGSAPALDSNGNVYVAVGNGDVLQPSPTSGKWGNSVLKLAPTLAYADCYTPNDWNQLDIGGAVCFAQSNTTCPSGQTHTLGGDTDMATGGVVLLSPTQLVSVGKQGIVYVIPYNPSTNGYMGGLDGAGYGNSSGSLPQNTACTMGTIPFPGNIAQCFAAVNFDQGQKFLDRQGVWAAPVFWSGTQNPYLYTIGLHDYMYWYAYNASNSPPFTTANPYRNEFKFCDPGSCNKRTYFSWRNCLPDLGLQQRR